MLMSNLQLVVTKKGAKDPPVGTGVIGRGPIPAASERQSRDEASRPQMGLSSLQNMPTQSK